ncbi:hypothetical protein X942_4253 [Burkholderia pseudomallei MSHR5596]|nr:hypothetical protein X942_4253 [Burkholderia pseudomallei MSHR5596]
MFKAGTFNRTVDRFGQIGTGAISGNGFKAIC